MSSNRHQYEERLQKKLSLGNHDDDFSENYALKNRSDIQSVPSFGASNDQDTPRVF